MTAKTRKTKNTVCSNTRTPKASRRYRSRKKLPAEQRTGAKRKLGAIIEKAERGDVLLTPEITRIAGSALAALEILKAASERGLIVHVTKQKIIMDGSLQSDIMATVLGLAAQIERHFIQARTTEALQVARERGKTLGRPQGQQIERLEAGQPY
ncbi:recombinase family protein [Klebsiella pneumoniae]|uniref:recombinase family protein n=1 Tax=Klebsiella pneumoniae TaxID=573 RepID=UPI001C8F3002|nr:recombinase family protein [Klebsiella pneumoniae]